MNAVTFNTREFIGEGQTESICAAGITSFVIETFFLNPGI
jgi:hypothetical protein